MNFPKLLSNFVLLAAIEIMKIFFTSYPKIKNLYFVIDQKTFETVFTDHMDKIVVLNEWIKQNNSNPNFHEGRKISYLTASLI